ncbi:hypothetical protein TNCV_1439851 [Trichonephila clavipes]|nr:hypothetical protein TNCV_1439851 [Trichonephila clavipes]
MSAKFAWELDTGGFTSDALDHLTGTSAHAPQGLRENAMANAFCVSVRNNISKRWITTEKDVSKNLSSADSAIRLPNTSILNSNAADITEYFLPVPNYIILNML